MHGFYSTLERRLENLRNGKREVKLKKKKPQLEWHLKNMKPKSHKYLDLFDEYLEDKPRVFNSMFPHKHSIQQLYEDEWRIKMMPLKVVALKVWQVIDFRLKCKYPLQVPSDITKLLEVQLRRCELQGLDKVIDSSSHFALGVKARLYPDEEATKAGLGVTVRSTLALFFRPLSLSYRVAPFATFLSKG
ncbi:hypothetical protein GOBAR_AA27549 [Gossypium barbadense]|uniref:Uncharacterized protein n=1 Tax=Gossypium barbadense TaxID=3634 RepID=A0A2P5WPW2_GOSBA|nr:hypothetical protein GOBAR_AA27549 [Gossypium barbadense]